MGFGITIIGLVLPLALAIITSSAQLYNSKTQLCCNGTLANKDVTKRMGCCGNQPYDEKLSICCVTSATKEVLTLPLVNGTSYRCCPNLKSGEMSLYRPMTHICCEGEIFDRPDPNLSYDCCNGTLYNIRSHLCCGQQIQVRGENAQCCGDQTVINWKTQVCCRSYGGEDGQPTFKHHDQDGNRKTCCGLEIYDSTIETCCLGVIEKKKTNVTYDLHCCGAEPYDMRTQTCCQKYDETSPGQMRLVASQVHDIGQGGAGCCGLDAYDYKEEVCCNGTIVPKPEVPNKSSRMTCCGGQAVTNDTAQLCVNDQIVERPSWSWHACGNDMYNSQNQQCCHDKIYDRNPEMACCDHAKDIYNRTTHQCCFDRIQAMSEEDQLLENDACCAVTYRYIL